ncbi:hypothetical protein WR25_26567 isoform C [Diploscapter pachys]|uniref:SET domain-containing protein n=1 Tax=Diploscapter pachys TaxID=2018661 RepID=A0A2A2LSE1_9BILA|nr:hypothetical protein WR25_26567 isoform C [Diploscapter pachys]
MVDIPKGAFIANYHGALLTTDLADQLQCDVYFADLDLKDSVEKCKVDEDCAMGFLDEAIGSSEGEQEDRPAQRRRKGSDDDDGVGSDLSDDQESTGQMRLRRKRKGTKRNYADDAGESDSSENAEQPKTTTRKIDNEDAIFLWDSYFTESESLFVLDAKDKGNIGRFYNHCCDPNIQTQHVLVDTHDLRLPWISFFACRNIKAGEVRTINQSSMNRRNCRNFVGTTTTSKENLQMRTWRRDCPATAVRLLAMESSDTRTSTRRMTLPKRPMKHSIRDERIRLERFELFGLGIDIFMRSFENPFV